MVAPLGEQIALEAKVEIVPLMVFPAVGRDRIRLGQRRNVRLFANHGLDLEFQAGGKQPLERRAFGRPKISHPRIGVNSFSAETISKLKPPWSIPRTLPDPDGCNFREILSLPASARTYGLNAPWSLLTISGIRNVEPLSWTCGLLRRHVHKLQLARLKYLQQARFDQRAHGGVVDPSRIGGRPLGL